MPHPTTGAPLAVELREGLPAPELHARLRRCLDLHEIGHRGLAFYLADMDARGIHQTTGHTNAVHYAECRLELSRRHAQELIQVGKALRELPAIDAAFADGRLSWSKVVLLARVATSAHEAAWLARATEATARELRQAVRLAKPGSAPRAPGDMKGLPEIRYDIRARVDVVTHRAIELAREKLSAERGTPIDDAALLSIAAELILGSDESGALPGRERIDGSLYRIVVHATEPRDSSDTSESSDRSDRSDGGQSRERLALDTRDGRVPLVDGTSEPAQRACLLCDGACSSAEGEAHVPLDGATPPALRRRVLARDDHACRCCGSKVGLMVHHIHFRGDGGRTRASNLISLCSHCHGLVHADLLVLAGEHAERIEFRDAGGALLEGRAPQASGGVVLARAPTDAVEPTATRVGCGDAEDPKAPAIPVPVPFEEAFEGIVGQDARLERLRWTLEGRRRRHQRAPRFPHAPLFPHTLFCGPPGTGKTTIARALARFAGVPLVEASGPTLTSVADVEALLGRMPTGGMLFLDEIHAVPRAALEQLYEAMSAEAMASEAGACDLQARATRPITLLAATTDQGDLPAALRSRFGLIESFDTYSVESLAAIAQALGRREGARIGRNAARVLAEHARGTPRTLVHLTRGALDHAASHHDVCRDVRRDVRRDAVDCPEGGTRIELGAHAARVALDAMGYDREGFTPLDRRYLDALHGQRGPVALRRLAAMLGVGASTLLDCVEPFLASRGLVRFTHQGRVASAPLRSLARG